MPGSDDNQTTTPDPNDDGGEEGKIDVKKLSYKANKLEKERNEARVQVTELQSQLAQLEEAKNQLEAKQSDDPPTPEGNGEDKTSALEEALEGEKTKVEALEGTVKAVLIESLEPILGKDKIEGKSLEQLQLLAETLAGVDLGGTEVFDRGGATVGDKGWPEGGLAKIMHGLENRTS